MAPESEWQTRKGRIDTRLKSLSPAWTIVRHREGLNPANLQCHAVEEYPTAHGPADYALFVQGKLVGIIEAKKVTVNPQNVLEQAKRYAAGVENGVGNWNGLKVPFLYATNGEIIWFLDARDEKPASRPVSNFHTSLALHDFLSMDGKPARDWLLDTPVERIERLRDYQRNAITAIEAGILARKRHLFVAMATGTGKTFMTVAQVYRLLESKVACRILFLVDQKALATKDEVSSKALERYGKFDRAEDYLEAFSKYIHEFSNEIEALKILLKRPKDWKPDVLEKLPGIENGGFRRKGIAEGPQKSRLCGRRTSFPWSNMPPASRCRGSPRKIARYRRNILRSLRNAMGAIRTA